MTTEPTTVDAETLKETPLGEGLICPECNERFKNAVGLGVHRAKEHDVAGARRNREQSSDKPRAPRTGSKGAELNRMRRQLKDASRALSLLPFMAKGSAENLNDPRIEAVIEEKSQAFADAWVAVAEENTMVRAALGQLLVGGVWLHAGIQTVAFGYCVAVFSNTIPLHPGAMMLLPELRQFTFAPAAAAAPANGGEHGAESPGAP